MRAEPFTRRSGSLALVASVVLVGFAGRASAHVKYVTPGGDPVEVAEFLAAALSDPLNLAVLLGGGAFVALLATGAGPLSVDEWLHYRAARREARDGATSGD